MQIGDIILSTHNPSKALQAKAVFAGSGLNILTLSEAGIEGMGIEDGTTLEHNAEAKARFAHKGKPGAWAMADDTGIFIDALNGEPGVNAAMWLREGAPAEETLAYCLTRMEGVVDRGATFRTVVVLISPEGETYTFTGEVRGVILTEPRCAPQPSMPYSPLFQPVGEEKTWAEMSTDYENRISHRGKAFAQVLEFLKKRMEA